MRVLALDMNEVNLGAKVGRDLFTALTPRVIKMYNLAHHGELAEWSIAHPWKGCIREIVSRVRIPHSPHCKGKRVWGKIIWEIILP